MDPSDKLEQTLLVSRQLVEEFQLTIAETIKVAEDSRRLIEQSHIILDKAKRTS